MNRDHEVVWNSKKAEQIKKTLAEADRILVGLGAGFPSAAGLEPLPLEQTLSAEHYWPFWLPYIQERRLSKDVPPLYQTLAQCLAGKNYFIIDSNPDGLVQHSGLALERIYKAQGDMGLVQCSHCQQTWLGRKYFAQVEKNPALPPVCPQCGGPLVMNVYTKKTGAAFCDKPYREKNGAYFHFINSSSREKLVLLELGVGYTMPELIRFPFEQIVQNHRQATLIRINLHHPLCVEENRDKAICVGADLAQVLPALV